MRPLERNLRLGELCAGYGGLGMAVEEVFGATTAWFSEFDDAPSKILKHHWPDVPNYGDMTAIDWAAIEPVDIISGGTPCQDLSHAGRRAGMTEGTRSNLWVQMREAIAIQKPTYVVWENVRGSFSAEASSSVEQCPGCVGDTSDGRVFLRALGRVLGDLSDLGFDTEWRGLRAADVGACHSRFRVFVLAAHPGRVGRREGNLPAGFGATSADGSTVPDQSDSRRLRPEHKVVPNPLRGGGRGRSPESGTARRHDEAVGSSQGGSWEGDTAAYAGGSTFRQHPGESSPQEAGAGDRDGSVDHRGEQPATSWGPYQPAIHRWESALGRRAPAPTEPTGRAGGHRLSPRFTEWMMGLPEGWVTDPAIGISRNNQLKACGNGVVPQQAIAALRDMLAAFEQKELAA